MIKNYISENIEKAFQVGGIYEEFDSLIDKKILIKLENNLKLYINNEFLDDFEVDFSFNKKFENINTLIINNIYSINDIEGDYNLEKYGLNIKKSKTDNNIFSITINNFDDFGLILMIPMEIKDLINYDDLCLDLFKLWDNIFNKIGLNQKLIIKATQKRIFEDTEENFEVNFFIFFSNKNYKMNCNNLKKVMKYMKKKKKKMMML